MVPQTYLLLQNYIEETLQKVEKIVLPLVSRDYPVNIVHSPE